MKKLVLLLAVVFSVSFFACNNKAAEAEAVAEDTVVEVVEEAVELDTVAPDSVVAEVAEEVVEAPAAE